MTSPSPRRGLTLIGATITAALALTGVVSVPAAAAPATSDSPEHPCSRTLPQGTSTVDVAFAGVTYPVRVHVPSAPEHRALPLVLDLHGSNNNATIQADISDLQDVADAEGFIVANPQGDIAFPPTLPDGNWGWNVPGVPLTSGNYPPAGSRDDIGFLTAVVDQIDDAGCVDDRRVYAAGYSGGGRMASALACAKSDVFAAIAPVAGLRAGRPDPADLTVPEAATCEPANPVAVVSFHGTADFVNPYPGNADPRWGYSVQLAASTWASLDGCRVGPTATVVSDEVTKYAWSKCMQNTDVVLYEVTGGGHTWPGTDASLEGLGVVTQDINASQIMWDFFEAHPKGKTLDAGVEKRIRQIVLQVLAYLRLHPRADILETLRARLDNAHISVTDEELSALIGQIPAG